MRTERDRELARQRHRRAKVRRLLARLAAARGEERERLLAKLQRIALEARPQGGGIQAVRPTLMVRSARDDASERRPLLSAGGSPCP